MLDKSAFVQELQTLADRFNRKISDQMVKRYYEDLARLSTDQFLGAARAIYTHDTFWPPPVRFLEAAGVDPKSEAEAAWELALEEATKGVARPLSEYDPAHRAALLVVGKNRVIGLTREDRLPFVKREFVSAFKAHRERGSLPELEKPDVPSLPGEFVKKALS